MFDWGRAIWPRTLTINHPHLPPIGFAMATSKYLASFEVTGRKFPENETLPGRRV